MQAFAWDNPNYPESSLKSLKEMPEGAEKEQIRAGLKCDNNRVSYVRDKVFIILDDVHKLAISHVDSELRGRGLV